MERLEESECRGEKQIVLSVAALDYSRAEVYVGMALSTKGNMITERSETD